MSQSATAPIGFAGVGPLPLGVDFLGGRLGGRLTSDGGLAWLAEADDVLGVTAALAAVIPDWRTRRGRHDLASQPTFSRLENAISARTCYQVAQALGTIYLRERERDGAPTRIVLDLDGTDDPTHGA